MLLVELPHDVLNNVLKFLTVRDLLGTRVTCRYLGDLTRSKDLWITFFRRDVFSSRLPSSARYCKALVALTAADCENLTVQPLRLHRQLSSSDTISAAPGIVSMNIPRSVTWLRVIHGQWLAVASSDTRHSILSLWALDALSQERGTPPPITEVYLEGPVKNGQCDVWNGIVLIALELCMETARSVCILALSGCKDRPVFSLLGKHEGVGCLRALRGPLLAFSLYQERCIPAVLNYVTGKVHRLYDKPKLEGGAVAMAITKGLLVAVFPHQLDIHFLSEDGQHSLILRTIKLSHSVGFAALSFIPASTPQDLDISNKTETLNFCLSGEDGVYLHSFSREDLINELYENQIPARSLCYSCPLDGAYSPRSTNITGPCCPTFDATGTVITWLSIPEDGSCRQYSFRILLKILSTEGKNAEEHRHPSFFELEHPDMPALYANGVYHYDAGLGIAVFGNMFGELALFNLSGSDARKLVDAFAPLKYPPVDEVTAMPTSPIPASFGFPFPYCGPYDPAPERINATIDAWKSLSFYPHDLPDGWEHVGVSAGDGDWYQFIPWTPRTRAPMALLLECVGHRYGTVVPLAENDSWFYFYAGGLFFLYSGGGNIEALPQSVTMRDILDFHGQEESAREVVFDAVASTWARAGHAMWQWERRILGRNRWEEMRQRGGDVSLSLVENLPPA